MAGVTIINTSDNTGENAVSNIGNLGAYK